MNLRRALVVSMLTCACSGTPIQTSTGQPVGIPSDWGLVDSRCHFTFRAPTDLARKEVRGIDSCVGQYESPRLTLTFDYGAYSSPLSEFKSASNYVESIVTIDGASAKLVAFDDGSGRAVGVYVADDGRGQKLSALAKCNTRDYEDTARALFSSIRW